MARFGVFTVEGLLEHCDSLDEARSRAAEYDPDDEAFAAEQCSEHEGELADGCEECEAEEEDEDLDD